MNLIEVIYVLSGMASPKAIRKLPGDILKCTHNMVSLGLQTGAVMMIKLR